jgi:hypothetical protein
MHIKQFFSKLIGYFSPATNFNSLEAFIIQSRPHDVVDVERLIKQFNYKQTRI